MANTPVKKAVVAKKATPAKSLPPQYYWNWVDDLAVACDSPYDSLSLALKEAEKGHRDNNDNESTVYIWKVERVAVKKLKTIVQITD